MGVCFRYYISDEGGSADEAVFWLSGDKSGQTLVYQQDRLQEEAVRMSRRYRRPAIYLARIGLDGSSGWHFGWRRSLFEIEATSRAIDAINTRHGFRIVHVAGQSGGGHLIGGLLALRRDIGCAVPGAGPLAFFDRNSAPLLWRPPAPHHYDPASRIREAARQSHATRILVVTNPYDQVAPVASQTEFVDHMRQLGGRISQFFVRALDERGHAVVPFTREAMAGCLAAASDAHIEAVLQRLYGFLASRQAAQQIGQPPPNNYREAVQPIEVPPAGASRIRAPRDAVSTTPPPPPPDVGTERYYR